MNEYTNILILTKDEVLGTMIRERLKIAGYQSELFTCIAKAFDEFCSGRFALCLVDMLSELKNEIPAKWQLNVSGTSLIFICDRLNIQEMSSLYALGADDLMYKPLNFEILIARIQAILRRKTSSVKEPILIYQFGKFKFDTHKLTLSINDKCTKLTSKESDLLKLLCEHANQLIDRNLALKVIWKNENYFNARSMDVYITKLRRLLDDDPTVRIMNQHGKGFKFITRS